MIFSRRLALLTLAGLLAGCSIFSPKPDLSRFYVLNAQTVKAAPIPPPDPTLSLVVFSADVPDYLDRPQMVSRLPGNQASLDEYHRWAEPLGAAVARVLAQNIALYSESSHVATFPVPPGFGQEFEVNVQILQFDGALDGDVTLRVQWRISGPGGKPNYYVHESTYVRRAGGMATAADPAAGYVDALSALAGDLSRDIVQALPDAQAAKAAISP
jgi:uncharacterized lipoprotein YmbA